MGNETKTEPGSEQQRSMLPTETEIKSPLGSDGDTKAETETTNEEKPTEETPNETQEGEENQESPNQETSKGQRSEVSGISEESLKDLKEKAANYDFIRSDPEALQKIQDHFAAKRSAPVNTGTKKPETQQKPASPELDELRNELRATKDTLNAMMQQHAQRIISEFKAQHPDFDNYRKEIGDLLTKYEGRMPLEEAYEFAKARSAGKTNGTSQKPALQSSETKSAGSRGNDTSDPIKAAEKKLQDRRSKPKRDFDEDIELALQAAAEIERRKG